MIVLETPSLASRLPVREADDVTRDDFGREPSTLAIAARTTQHIWLIFPELRGDWHGQHGRKEK